MLNNNKLWLIIFKKSNTVNFAFFHLFCSSFSRNSPFTIPPFPVQADRRCIPHHNRFGSFYSFISSVIWFKTTLDHHTFLGRPWISGLDLDLGPWTWTWTWTLWTPLEICSILRRNFCHFLLRTADKCWLTWARRTCSQVLPPWLSAFAVVCQLPSAFELGPLTCTTTQRIGLAGHFLC